MAEHSCIWYIRNLQFFPQLDDETKMEIAGASEMIEAKRGDLITVRSTVAGNAYLVKDGHLRIVRFAPDGRTVGLDILSPGDVIGLTTVMTQDEDQEAAEAMEDVLFCRIPAKVLRAVLERHPHLALHYSKIVGLRRRTVEMRLLNIAFSPVRVRVARLLLELRERFGATDGVLIRLKLTHQEIGDMIGSNREAANRAVSALIDEGAIRFQGKMIEVLDVEKLKAAADLAQSWHNVSGDTA